MHNLRSVSMASPSQTFKNMEWSVVSSCEESGTWPYVPMSDLAC